jgi:hypothetical protein
MFSCSTKRQCNTTLLVTSLNIVIPKSEPKYVVSIPTTQALGVISEYSKSKLSIAFCICL